MRIPAEFRKELGEGFCLTRGTNGSIYVFPASEGERVRALVSRMSILDAEEVKLTVKFLKNFDYPNVDEQNRFVLDQNLKKRAKIDKELVVVGSGAFLTIWGAEWFDYVFNDDDDDEDYDASMKKLKRFVDRKAEELAKEERVLAVTAEADAGVDRFAPKESVESEDPVEQED
jgi:MraZ protein